MSFASLLGQLLNGLAGASSLFLVAAGLSLVFGVTRVVNFAHGALYMLGLYVAYWLIGVFGGGALAFWAAIAAAPAVVAAVGLVIEVAVLRRIYRAPALFQLLATFAVALLLEDAVLWLWGPQDLLGPRAPGLSGAIDLLGQHFPQYDALLIALGPALLGLLWLLLTRTDWGTRVRAATFDREMAAALGVNQAALFSAVFALGAGLAGLGGALQIPREPAALGLDLQVIGDAFVVVVVGGLGSIPGAFVAALIIGQIKALCVGIGTLSVLGVTVSLSKFTLVVEFVVMAAVLMVRPWGLYGRPLAEARREAAPAPLPGPVGARARMLGWLTVALLAALPWVARGHPYLPVLALDALVAALFAASLHLIMGPAGMHSFGHAAYFGLGAYGAALAVKKAGLAMLPALLAAPVLAGLGALLFGWFCVRLSGIYLAMLTLAFAQILWSVAFQWDELTGGSNGLVGIWPSPGLQGPFSYYELVLAVCVIGVLLIRRLTFSPFGFALRAGRDSTLRAEAIGIDVAAQRWSAFVIAATAGGMAGALFVFSKGSLSPETLGVGRSIDALVMVLLGGLDTVAGPLVGSAVYTVLQDFVARHTEYWHAWLGLLMLLLVVLFPAGIVGWSGRRGGRGAAA